jgi:hypothetical protein
VAVVTKKTKKAGGASLPLIVVVTIMDKEKEGEQNSPRWLA